MDMAFTGLAAFSLAAWVYLIFFRGGFWRADQRLTTPPRSPDGWPAVAAVVPARDEAPVIGRALRALLAQDYPGPFSVVVVDDHSDDGTAEVARVTAAGTGHGDLLAVVKGSSPEPGWTGKMWALAQGVDRAAADHPDARYILLTDADIEHGPGTLRDLVAKAEAESLDLVSLMALLRCETPWERLLIPAFVFFFQKLYPFPWVNDPSRRTAGAAGGCILVRRAALARAGGIATIGGALIDDCAFARVVKRNGPLWLGLSDSSRSIRPYAGLSDIWAMVARSAYTQLRHSAVLLAATVVGMIVIYLGPPLAVVAGAAQVDAMTAAIGAAAWLLMAAAYVPTLRLYRRPLPAALLLPLSALLYTLMTVDSALRHWRGTGGSWKGRSYGPPSSERRAATAPTDKAH
jgi:hopene-associated glycosyltransferase HpnB